MKRVGSSMVEQRPFKALVAGSSPAQPSSPGAWVYILRGSSGRHYIGCTENLQRRISEHSRGNNHTTRRLGGDIQLVVAKQFPSVVRARAIEFDLKRKKNPQLAILALQNKTEQPRKPSALVAGSSRAQPNQL
jgi:predicted GIY-YIG superfamily endonuclease